jgi:hypothetical protein
MKVRSIRAKVALALSSLTVLLFAVVSALRFYHEQIDVFDENGVTQVSTEQVAEARGVPIGSAVCRCRGGCGRMAGRLTDPPIRLANAAEGMDARTLNKRLPEPRDDDEISRLTCVLNSLFRRLEKSFRASQSLRCRRLTRTVHSACDHARWY